MKTSNDEAEEGVCSDAAAPASAMEANGDVEVSGWRNPRRAATWVRAPDRLALDNNGASGSRVIDFSSDEDDAAGKQHGVIDLASSDSPVPEAAAGPSGESPPRRDQRPESADAKRARRGEEPEPEASGEAEAPASLEPYNLRRGRNNLNLGVSRLDRRALASNNGLVVEYVATTTDSKDSRRSTICDVHYLFQTLLSLTWTIKTPLLATTLLCWKMTLRPRELASWPKTKE